MKLFKRKFKTHLKIKDCGPVLLTGLSICGVIFTAAAAIHDTPKAMKVLKHEEDDRAFRVKMYADNNPVSEYRPLTIWEKAHLTWKCYVPTILIAGSTIFCILYSSKLNIKQKKQLLAAYALLHTSYYEYRQKVQDLHGDDDEVINSICKDHYKTVEMQYGNGKPGEPTFIFVDSFMKTVFESTKEAVLEAEYELNRTFALRGYVSMGDFYRYLGLDDVYAEPDVGPLLERFGWSYDIGTDMGYEWIDFNHKKIEEEGQPETYEISYPFEPVLGYMYG